MMTPVLGIWSLGSAAMLAWGAAAAIPLVIHLWSRRRYRETDWAAMPFLIAALKKHSRRLQLEQWLLLAVRMLLLIFLAAALANPLWSGSLGSALASRAVATHYVFVLDTSFSMGYRERDQTRLQAAQSRIRGLIESAGEGDGFSLVLLQRPPAAQISDVAFDRMETIRQIENVPLSHGTADLPATFAIVEQLVRQARERYPRLERRRICVFSDLGLNTWSQVTSPSSRGVFDRLAGDSDWELFDLGSEQSENLAVTSLAASRERITIGDRVQFTAEVRSFGQETTVPARIEFLVNGQVRHSGLVQVSGGGREDVSWEWTSEFAGEFAISARIAADRLTVDNERWRVVHVRQSWSVLAVEGEPGAGEFVALALVARAPSFNPQPQARALSFNPQPQARAPESQPAGPIQVTVADESALLERELSTFDCVFLCNVGRLSAPEASALRDYVQGGGGLVFSLGDQVQAANYNRELGADGVGILPARLEEVERGEFLFDPLEYRHPLVAPFRGRERAGLLTAPTWRYFQLQPYRDSTVALGFSAPPRPAVVEMRVGRGRSILVATALSTSSLDRSSEPATPWTALPAWPSFPPLVHGLFRAAMAEGEFGHTVEVGSPLVIALAESEREAIVIRPDQSRERLALQHAVESHTLAYEETTRGGVYTVEVPGSSTGNRLYAANLDTAESELRRLPRSSRPAQLTERSANEPHASADAGQDRPHPLFRPLLATVGLLLLAEQLLAVLFARRSL